MRFKIMLRQNGFSIVREYVGHGVGKDLHEDSDIPHYDSQTTVHVKSLDIIGPKRSYSAKRTFCKSY
jgi:methionine aminopeptidase